VKDVGDAALELGTKFVRSCYASIGLANTFLSHMKHNSYFDGRVQSIGFERNGMRATVGVIEPGEYHFNTAAAERMTVTTGLLRAKLAGSEWQSYPAGTYFEVPANSGFDVQAVGGPAGYLCEFLSG
jgi:purine/pyrimidine-nucleoside phosphorylase